MRMVVELPWIAGVTRPSGYEDFGLVLLHSSPSWARMA